MAVAQTGRATPELEKDKQRMVPADRGQMN